MKNCNDNLRLWIVLASSKEDLLISGKQIARRIYPIQINRSNQSQSNLIELIQICISACEYQSVFRLALLPGYRPSRFPAERVEHLLEHLLLERLKSQFLFPQACGIANNLVSGSASLCLFKIANSLWRNQLYIKLLTALCFIFLYHL